MSVSALLWCCGLPLVVHLQAGFTLRQLSAQGLPALHLPLELSLQPDVLLPHLSLLFDVLSSLLCVCRPIKGEKIDEVIRFDTPTQKVAESQRWKNGGDVGWGRGATFSCVLEQESQQAR